MSTQSDHDTSQSKIKLWQLFTAGVGCLLLFFAVLFLIQRNTAEEAVHQKAVLESQLTRKESEIRNLNASIQTLEGENETLTQKINGLENPDKNGTFPIETTSTRVASLARQLNNLKSENQNLQSQLVKKEAEIRQLRNDNATALSNNRALQSQIDGTNPGPIDQNTITDQNVTIQRLKAEKIEIQRQNQKLQGEKEGTPRPEQKSAKREYYLTK